VAARVHPVLDQSLPDCQAPAPVIIKTRKGIFETRTSYPYGSIQNPIAAEDLEAKFLDCASFSRNTLSGKNLATVISMVRNLEEVGNVKEIMGFVC